MLKIISAVTTCPRKGEDYLPQTLDSLAEAGFDSVVIVEDENCIGPWPTFRKALALLLGEKPDAVCIFQDDIIAARGLSDFVQRTLTAWHADKNKWQNLGVASLYASGANQVHMLHPGWHKLADLPSYDAFGACALALTREVAAELVARDPSPGTRTGTDGLLGRFCCDTLRDYWLHSPSLVQHVGKHSAINDGYALVWDMPLIQLNRTASKFCADCRDL